MKYQGKSMMSLNEMAGRAIEYKGDGYVTGYPIVSGDDAYILNGVIEANEEYIAINQWVPVFPESLKPVSPSLTDDQQVVLEWLKEAYERAEWSSPFGSVYSTINNHEYFLRMNLDKEQQFQVLAAFGEWGGKSSE